MKKLLELRRKMYVAATTIAACYVPLHAEAHLAEISVSRNSGAPLRVNLDPKWRTHFVVRGGEHFWQFYLTSGDNIQPQ